MLHVGEQERVGRAGMMRVVNDEIRFGDAVAEWHDFDVAIGLAADAFVVVFAEDQRLAMLELENVLAARGTLRERKPSAGIESAAGLHDFHKRGAFLRGGWFQRV